MNVTKTEFLVQFFFQLAFDLFCYNNLKEYLNFKINFYQKLFLESFLNHRINTLVMEILSYLNYCMGKGRKRSGSNGKKIKATHLTFTSMLLQLTIAFSLFCEVIINYLYYRCQFENAELCL